MKSNQIESSCTLNLGYAINLLCQFMHAPSNIHQVVTPVLTYVKATIHYEIRILVQSIFQLYGIFDADLVGCPDTRRSTTGYYMFLGSNCVFWSTKNQPPVSRSSTEVEYLSMPTASFEITLLTFLLRLLGLPYLILQSFPMITSVLYI